MNLSLTLISGLAWTLVYLESIRIGFRDRTYAMPIAALGLNFAWEWIYALDGFAATNPQSWVNLVWGCLDVAILVTFLRFGRSELPAFVSRSMFLAWGAAMVGIGFVVQALFLAEFGLAGGKSPTYSAFLQNALMSGLFIAMFVARRGVRGQSLTIAVAKWLGTLAPTIQYGAMAGSAFVLGLGGICSVLDLTYIGLLLWATRMPDTFARATPPASIPAGGAHDPSRLS